MERLAVLLLVRVVLEVVLRVAVRAVCLVFVDFLVVVVRLMLPIVAHGSCKSGVCPQSGLC